MATDAVIDLVRRYLNLLREEGFHVQRAVVFGSQARDEAHADSDIDLLIPSPDFDALTWKQEERIWSLTARLDSRIEPIPCGESRWRSDEVSPLIEAVRLEGIVIDMDPQVPPHPAREVAAFNLTSGGDGAWAQGGTAG
jgi:predicted nucleotidyltransferase